MASKTKNYTPVVKTMVAVYGSLRVGEGNSWMNDEANAIYLGGGKTHHNYNIYEHHGKGFPHVSMKHNDSETPVVVDVFEIAQSELFSSYDRLEGYPSFYDRTKIAIKMYNDDMLEAWMYHIDEDYPVPVRSGDWSAYLEEHRVAMAMENGENIDE